MSLLQGALSHPNRGLAEISRPGGTEERVKLVRMFAAGNLSLPAQDGLLCAHRYCSLAFHWCHLATMLGQLPGTRMLSLGNKRDWQRPALVTVPAGMKLGRCSARVAQCLLGRTLALLPRATTWHSRAG